MACLSRFGKVASTVSVLVILCGFGLSVTANEREYAPRSNEEVDILSLVVGSEIKANNWPMSTLICFTVDGLDPSAKLTKSLRDRYSSVRSSAEWPKKFNCGYELQLQYTQFDPSGDIKVRSKVIDLREINKGEGHIAILVKDGEYSLQRVGGRWSTKAYAAKPVA